MTEIPEHLLKRSRERRSSLGLPVEGETGSGGGEPPAGDTPAASPAASSPAPAPRAAAAAPAPAPPPKPVPAYVQLSLRRRRVPLWAMPVVALLPVWLLVYVNAMRPSTAGAVGPLGEGAQVYSSKCVSCHGSSG
ncbi:MAG: hypothetical protein QOJ12_3489, partial [Thermoleophilales bacterium]|nr:hypothetical protein [Thermoleophilales bacterium]